MKNTSVTSLTILCAYFGHLVQQCNWILLTLLQPLLFPSSEFLLCFPTEEVGRSIRAPTDIQKICFSCSDFIGLGNVFTV